MAQMSPGNTPAPPNLAALVTGETARAQAAETAAIATAAATADAKIAAQHTADSSTYVLANRPSWASKVNTFDPATGCYNLNARTLSRFRKAKARAVAGSGALHISVLGDSTTMQATYTNSAYVQAWPGRLRDHLIRALGLTNAGTGLMGTWDLFGAWNFTADPAFPHLSWPFNGGSFQRIAGKGIYGYNCTQIASGTAPYTAVQVNPIGGQMVDQFWVYLISSGDDTQVEITDGTTTYKFQIAAYYGKTVTPASGYTAVACEPGFVQSANPPAAGGIRVAKLVVPAQTNWTATIHSLTGAVADITMFEARLSTASLRVSNLAQGGIRLADLIAATDDGTGGGGLPQGIDTPGADLAIIALGLNDWQAHGTVATFKSQITTLVQRQKFVGATGNSLTGTGAAGDALLYLTPTPDLTRIPATGGNVPPLADFWEAAYQVADEQNVALIDESWRWTDYTTSAPMYRAGDAVHGNEIGHADIGVNIGSVLARI